MKFKFKDTFDKASQFFIEGKYAKAIKLYQQAIEMKPDDFQSHLNLGKSYIKIEQADLAIEYINKALSIDSNNPEAHQYLGLAYSMSGKYISSIENNVEVFFKLFQ